MERDRHCSYCGTAFAVVPFPRTCASCKQITYRNPIPVAVLLLPVDDGLLGIRRGIEPKRGEIALPGGYIDAGETWQEGAARELREETGIVIDPAHVQDHGVRSVPGGGPVLVFGVGPRLTSRDLPTFVPTDETTERVVIGPGQKLAFPLHEWAAGLWFSRR